MEKDLENKDWEKEVPFLAGLDKHDPFDVPAGYFNTLSERIKAQVFLADLQHDNDSACFGVPAGYFENLTDRVEARASVESLKEQIGSGGFVVPDYYFENLATKVAARTTNEKPARLVRLLQSHYFKYSAVACLVLMSAIFLYINELAPAAQNRSYTDAATEQMLFDIDEETIIEHIQHSETEQAAGDISEKELESYILSNFSQSDLTSE